MTDVAALGLSIDSSEVVYATTALENFNAETAKSPGNVSRLTTASDALIAALNRNTQATDALSARMSAMEAAASKTATSLTQVGQASERATSNVVQFNTAATRTRTELEATTAAVDKMTAAWSRLGSAGAEVSKNLTPSGVANFRLTNMSSDGTAGPEVEAALRRRRQEESMWANLGPAGQQVSSSLSPQALAEFRLRNMSGNGSVPTAPVTGPATNTSGRLNAYQAQNLFYQGTDVIASAASGMSPLTIALQQGGQIAPSFMGPQGASISGVFSQVTEGIGKLVARINPLTIGATAAAAAVAALVLAQQNYAESQKAITRALATGDGRRSGATAADINAVAAGGNGELSRGTRRDYATQLAGAGVNPALYGGLLDSLKDYSATTGQDQTAALSSLGQAFADPSKGAEALNKQLGFLDATTLDNIKTLQAQGDKLGASKLLLEAYSGSLVKASELTSGWAKVTEAVLTPIANLWDRLGEKVNTALTGGSLDDRIRDMQNVLQQPKGFFEGVSDRLGIGGRDALQKQLDDLTRQRAQGERRSQVAQQGDASLALDNTLRALNPQAEALKQLETQAEAIRRPFRENWIDPNRQAQAALQGLATQTRQMVEDLKAGGAQYADAIRNAQQGLRTVGFAPEAKSVADIQAQREQKDIDARRRASLDSSDKDHIDSSGLDRALASNKQEMDLLLEAQKQRFTQTEGKYSTNLRDVPAQYQDQVYGAATRAGIDPNLLSSVFYQESRFRPEVIDGRVRSSAGATGPFQFMPATSQGAGIDPLNFQQAADEAAKMIARSLKNRNGDEALALADYNYGAGNVNDALKKGRAFPRETRDYIADITRGRPNTAANIEDQQQRTRQLEQEKQNLDALGQSQGKNTEAYRAQLEVINRLTEDQAKNRQTSESLRQTYVAEAKARQELQTATQFKQYVANDNFAREQLGRTQDEQNVANAARPYEGTQYYDQVTQRASDTQSLQQTKQMVMEGATTFVSALRRGASASEALSQAFGNAADKLLNKALDGIISGAFNMLQQGGGGGGLGGLFKLGGDSGLPDFSFPSFSSGGYTGAGGRYDPAGIVHRGEVVFSQSDVARFGGAAVVERMRQGFPGYADGGIVGGGSAAGGGAGQTNIQVNMQGSSGDPQKDQAHVDNTVKALRDEMNTTWHQNLSKSLQTNGALWKAGVRRAAN